jgi:hypothetical protein
MKYIICKTQSTTLLSLMNVCTLYIAALHYVHLCKIKSVAENIISVYACPSPIDHPCEKQQGLWNLSYNLNTSIVGNPIVE